MMVSDIEIDGNKYRICAGWKLLFIGKMAMTGTSAEDVPLIDCIRFFRTIDTGEMVQVVRDLDGRFIVQHIKGDFSSPYDICILRTKLEAIHSAFSFMSSLDQYKASLPSIPDRRIVLDGVCDCISALLEDVSKLNELYEKNEWLNNCQPANFEKVIPKSLDEWMIELSDAKEEWHKVRHSLLSRP